MKLKQFILIAIYLSDMNKYWKSFDIIFLIKNKNYSKSHFEYQEDNIYATLNNMHGSLMDYLISVRPYYLVIMPFIGHIMHRKHVL